MKLSTYSKEKDTIFCQKILNSQRERKLGFEGGRLWEGYWASPRFIGIQKPVNSLLRTVLPIKMLDLIHPNMKSQNFSIKTMKTRKGKTQKLN